MTPHKKRIAGALIAVLASVTLIGGGSASASSAASTKGVAGPSGLFADPEGIQHFKPRN